jgi:hypothetical protein
MLQIDNAPASVIGAPPEPAPDRRSGCTDILARNPPERQRETRERGSCYGAAYMPEDVAYSPASGELTGESAAHGRCKGAGEVSHFVYGRIW